MDVFGYMSEVIIEGPIPIGLDGRDQLFLSWILEGDTSAYKIYSRKKKTTAYKNVNRRIKKLFDAKLIEEVTIHGGFKHGARNYRLTSRGLVYILAEEYIPLNDVSRITSMYPDNILFNTFLYPYFDRRTIKLAPRSLVWLINKYIEETCEITRYTLDLLAEHHHDFHKKAITIEPSNILLYPELIKLYIQLTWHIKSFLFKVASMKEEDIYFQNRLYPGIYISSHSEVANMKTEMYNLLSQDQTFMRALNNLERDFREGYQKLFEMKRNKNIR